MNQIINMPVVYPVTPPRNANHPTFEFFNPIARSIPCTGKGVNTSQLRNPAFRTFSAACNTPAAVRNSAIIPYGLASPFIPPPPLRESAPPPSRRRPDDADQPALSRL